MMLRRPMRSDRAPKTTKKRSAQGQRDHHDDVHGEVIDLENRGQIEQRIELARVPDDPFGRGGAEQRDQHQTPIFTAAEAAVGRRIGRRLALLFEAGEKWGFLKLESDVARQHDQNCGEQERDAPAPVAERLVAEPQPADEDNQERQDDPHRRRGLDPAGVKAASAVR